MGRKIYVGNLPFNTTEPQLVEIFGQIGQVQSVRIITDPISGRSKGFGFIEMVSESDVSKAIDRFHGAEFQGRPLTVSQAKGAAEPRKR
ncbi:MAG: RNA recognition motif domain-containing protein [Oligoflexia bacterium]|jgi:RNA recognition motif-containing protein